MTLKEERELKKAAKLEAEKQRIEAMREYEQMYDTFSYICGIDEAGRGPLIPGTIFDIYVFNNAGFTSISKEKGFFM